jgi:hypothetical protein
MRSFFRFLLWLSFMVLSFQGSTAMALEQAEVPAHDMVVAVGHQHQQAADQTAGEHCGKHGSEAPASPHAKCAACASCCVGSAAPPGLMPSFHAPPLASSHHANQEAAMTSFVPPALERPPRHSFV